MRRSSIAAAVALVGIVGVPNVASAARPAGCDLVGPDELPVIFVHGWVSGPDVWVDGVGSPTFDAVDALDSAVAIPFDYSTANTDWVTDKRIGPALAKLVDCAARASDYGRVIIVAHSMGGLAARYASAQSSTAGDIGLAITIGTPHKGTKFFNDPGTKLFKKILRIFPKEGKAREAMYQGSAELRALEMFEESGVPGLYLAGDLRNARNAAADLAGTDGLVPTESAVPAQPLAGPGAGKQVIRCHFQVPCLHTNLPGLDEVRDAVLDAIEAWIVANELPSEEGDAGSAAETLRRVLEAWARGDEQTVNLNASITAYDQLFDQPPSPPSTVDCFPSLSGSSIEMDCIFSLVDGRGGSAGAQSPSDSEGNVTWVITEVCIEEEPGDCAI